MTALHKEDNESDYFLSTPQHEGDENDGQLTPMNKTYPPADNPGSHAGGSFLSRFKQSICISSIAGFLGHGNHTNPRLSHRKQPSNVSNNSALSESSHMPLAVDLDSSVATTPRRRSLATDGDNSPCLSYSTPHSCRNMMCCTSPKFYGKATNSADFSETLVTVPLTALTLRDMDTLSDELVSPALTSSSESRGLSTPPLTPEILEANDYQNSNMEISEEGEPLTSHALIIEENSGNEVGKGKEPAPPFPYETLLADISIASKDVTSPAQSNEEVYGEWWGLDYTIELSRRDSRASDSSISTGGEHSKSRESWAAIHQGTVSRQNEDTNFFDWLHWHHSLERLDMKRRRKRTFNFLQSSDRLAKLFADELLARTALELHENKLTEEEIYDAFVWVEYASERRGDPYFPPEKHNLGWVLKSHRSVGCMRDLQEMAFSDE